MDVSRTAAAPLREFALDTETGRIAGLRSAAAPGAPRVLALHGWLDNAASFVPMHPYLDGIELVAADLPGHGGSAHLPASAEYTVVNAARVMFAAADALGWDRFALLGHSLGAAISSLMAAALPERVTRLVAIETLGALADDATDTALRLHRAFAAPGRPRKPLRVYPDVETATQARVAAGGIEPAAARLLVERGLAPAGTGQGTGHVWRSDPRLTRATAVRMSEPQVRDLLAAIECPVHVVYATPAQPYFPEPLRQARFECLRDAHLTVLDGGHHLHMEQPATVAAAIAEFLKLQS